MFTTHVIKQEDIVYVSLDADNCVYNRDYHTARKLLFMLEKDHPASEMQTIIKTNPLLFYFFKHIKPDFIFCGSARQCQYFDKALASQNHTSLFFEVLPDITRHIESLTGKSVSLDKFLIRNIYTSTTNHFDKLDEISEEHRYYTDNAKGVLLYLQLNRAASLHKNKKVQFYFIDDDEHTILSELKIFFTDNSNFFPPNVTLNLLRYDGTCAPQYYCTPITGTGVLDCDFEKNALVLCAIYSLTVDRQRYYLNQSHAVAVDINSDPTKLTTDPNQLRCRKLMLCNMNSAVYGMAALKQFKVYLKSKTKNPPKPDPHLPQTSVNPLLLKPELEKKLTTVATPTLWKPVTKNASLDNVNVTIFHQNILNETDPKKRQIFISDFIKIKMPICDLINQVLFPIIRILSESEIESFLPLLKIAKFSFNDASNNALEKLIIEIEAHGLLSNKQLEKFDLDLITRDSKIVTPY